MKKLIATISLAILAVGSIYGCVVAPGHPGDGPRGSRMDHQGDGRHDRDDNRDDRRDDHRGPGDRDHH